MKSSLARGFIGALVAMCLPISAAIAGHPASVAGNWQLSMSGGYSGSLVIRQSGLTGSYCKPITGTISVPGENISGFYCPALGRIVFSGATTQRLYQGYLGKGGGITDFISGAYVVWNAAGGRALNEGVDFPFSAVRKNPIEGAPQ